MYPKLAWRNLWRNSRRTLITVSSVGFAVLFAVLAMSVNRGSHENMIDNMARFHTGFLQIHDVRYDEEPSLDNAIPYDEEFSSRVKNSHGQIEFLVPRIETFMLAAGDDQTRGAMVLGVDPARENRLNDVEGYISEGQFLQGKSSGSEAVIGKGLAGRLELSVGDTLILLGQGRFGMTASGKFAVAGLVDHPLTEFDNQIVYLPLSEAQWMLSAENHITSLLVTPTEVRFTDDVRRALQDQLEKDEMLMVKTWQEMMPELLQALEFDRVSGYVILAILYTVIAFGLFGTILTMTLERLREFGVLLSIGMQRGQIIMVLFIETIIIGLLGVAAGSAIGFSVTYYLHLNPVELTGDVAGTMLEMGIEPILPFSIAPQIYISQAIVVFILSVVISVYPMVKIGTLNILDAARR